MFSVSIDDLMNQVRAERDRMRAVLSGAQGPSRDDLALLVEHGDDDDRRDQVMDRYRDYVTRSGALIERYAAEGR